VVDRRPTRDGFASWGRRAAALGIDLIPVAVLFSVSLAVMWFTRIRACDFDVSALDLGAQCASPVSPVGFICYVVAWVAAVAYVVWNLGWRQGRSGASIGKSAMGIRVVGAQSRVPIGFWWALARVAGQLLNLLTLGIGYLWALADRRRQTLADKLVASVCVRADGTGGRTVPEAARLP
jgi:uncharacterized RDD family membrane protein YckC